MTYSRSGLERARIPVVYPANLSDREWARFLSSFDLPDGDVELECWIWRGNRNARGYGRFRIDPIAHGGPTIYRYAHRLMYALVYGPPPLDKEIDHTCGRGRDGCVNPYQLRAVTWKVNEAAKAARNGDGEVLDDLDVELVDAAMRHLAAASSAEEIPF